MNWAQGFFALSGSGALLLVVGFFLLISMPWPATRAEVKRWTQKPMVRGGIICVVLSAMLLIAASIPLLR